jgi:hypothetical protein
MRSWVKLLLLVGGCGAPLREEAPSPTSVPQKTTSEPVSLPAPVSLPQTAPASTPATLPPGALPLGAVIRIDSFAKEDPLSVQAKVYVGLVCVSSLEGLFVDAGVARGLVLCGVSRQEIRLTNANVTLVFTPR